jgi:hypothetical protein
LFHLFKASTRASVRVAAAKISTEVTVLVHAALWRIDPLSHLTYVKFQDIEGRLQTPV